MAKKNRHQNQPQPTKLALPQILWADRKRVASLLNGIRRLSGRTTHDLSGIRIVIFAGISGVLMCASLYGQEVDLEKSKTSAPDGVRATQTAEPRQDVSEETQNEQDAPEAGQVLLNIPIPPPQAAFGIVVDENGKPIPGVKVQAASPRQGDISTISMPTGGDDIPGKTAVTDSEGRFRIEDIPGFWGSDRNGKTPVMLRLRTPYRWRNDQNYPLGESLTIQLTGSGKQGTLRMRLVDDVTGLPINKFTVVKRHDATTKVTTHATGDWQLKGEFTRHRKYIVYCYADEYEAIEVRPEAFDPNSDERTVVRLKPRPSLKVRMVDSDSGRPVSNARMMAARLGDQKRPAWYISWRDFNRYVDGNHSFNFVQHKKTDESGLTSFSQLPEGKLALIVFTNGYQRMIVRPEDREKFPTQGGVLQVSLQREAKVFGRLTNGGKPVEGARVWAGTNDKIAGLDQMSIESDTTDADGNYVIRSLASGSYRIEVAGYGKRFNLETGVVRHDVALQGTTVYGQTLKNFSLRAVPKFDAGYEHANTRTDENGKYEIPGLSAGPHTIRSYGFDGGLKSEFSAEIDVRNVATMKVDVLPPAAPFQYQLFTPGNKERAVDDSKTQSLK
jgi:hypothetical protein